MMIRTFTLGPRVAACALALALPTMTMTGCQKAQSSSVELAPVAGKITLDEKPLAEASVEFVPIGETRGQGGGATTDEEGQFKAATPFGEEGLPPGDYKVVVSKLTLPKGMHFDVPPDRDLPPIESPYRESLPPHYSDREKSKLTIKVSPNGTDKMSFTLKSGSGKS